MQVIAALDYSTQWKNVSPFFHTMEKCFAVFPHCGKLFSTPWKTALIQVGRSRRDRRAVSIPAFSSIGYWILDVGCWILSATPLHAA
jgi:hypothetical protein